MEVYQSEEEQVEALKKWWDENGKSIIFGVILGLGAIFGWREWLDYNRDQSEGASALYERMVMSISTDSETDEARQIADEIISGYDSTTYAVFAELALARMAVTESDYQTAAEHLRQALENNPVANIEPLIRLRLARVLMAMEDYPQALAELEAVDPGKFASSYDELRGDISRMTGDIDAARSFYQQALSSNRNMDSDVTVLEIKLDDLGRIELQ